MKKVILILQLCFIFFYNNGFSQGLAINETDSLPDLSAMLDISSSNKGLLIPRVELLGLFDTLTIDSPAISLLVYNINDTYISKGFYYWDGNLWQHISNTSTEANNWTIKGNNGINPETDFLGSIDSIPLKFKTNNNQRMVITGNGNVGIGTASPTYKLETSGTTAEGGVRSGMGYDIYQVPNPTAPTGVLHAGTELGIGNYYYRITYYTAFGETASTGSAVITTTSNNQEVTLTIPVSTDSRVIGRKLYRTKVGNPYYNDYFLITIANNIDVTYLDLIPDASLTGIAGASFFKTNTTTNYITLNGTRAAMLDASVTSFGISSTGDHLTTGGWITAFGYNAGHNLTSGADNAFFGRSAGLNVSSGLNNTACGSSSLQNLTTGGNNVALGCASGGYNQTGSYNISIGVYALNGVTSNSNSYNTAVGHNAGFGITTGTYNTYLGYKSGYAGTSVANRIFLGSYAGYYETGSNTIIIDNLDRTTEALSRTSALIYGVTNTTPTSQVLALGGGGNVGIGTTTPAYKLDVNGNIYSSGYICGITNLQSNQFTSAGNATINISSRGTNNIQFGTGYAGTPANTMIIEGSTGKVGIGTTSPIGQLDVVGSIIARYKTSPSWPTDANGYVATYVYDNSGTKVGRILPYTGSSYIDLAIGDWNSGNPNIMLKVGGSVGIGTGSPSNKLSVTGNADISGKLGMGITSPTAVLDLKAGTSSASTAPLKFTSGTNLTTAETGAMEYDGTNLFFTPTGTLRENVHTGGRGSITLTAGTTTTVTNSTAKTTSTIIISPTSLSVIALTPYISAKNNGSFVITTLNAVGTETLDYLIIN